MAAQGRQLPDAAQQPARLLCALNQPLILRFSILQMLRLLLGWEQTTDCYENRGFIRRQPAKRRHFIDS
jgi:hypothetical protein